MNTTILILCILAVFLGTAKATPDAEVMYRWGEHLEQYQRGLGFLAEMRELAHLYTASWMSVACIEKKGNMPAHLKSDTKCNIKNHACTHAAASSAFYTMWVIAIQNRKDIFNPANPFFSQTDQDSIIASSTAFYNTQKQWIKDNVCPNDEDIDDGEDIGRKVALWIWDIRGHDGHNSTTSSFVAKCPSPPCPIGVWWPYSANAKPPAPQWADLVLLCDDPDLFDGDNDRENPIFQVPPPPLPLSLNANASADEIYQLGRLGSTTRTADQTEVGRFWHEGTGFYYFVPVMRAIDAGYGGLPLIQVLRALMHASAATFDANIVQYHYKFKYQSWRPWQRFNHHLWGTPENPTPSPPGKSEGAIQNIPGAWLPFTMTTYPGPTGAAVPSPNHPDYPAGHPTGTGAWTRMFELLFPDIQGTNFPAPGFGYLNKTSRVEPTHKFNMRYSNTAEVTQQIIGARMYVGYHFTYSSIVGVNTGRHVARSCFDKLSKFTGENPNYGTWTGGIPDMLQYH